MQTKYLTVKTEMNVPENKSKTTNQEDVLLSFLFGLEMIMIVLKS